MRRSGLERRQGQVSIPLEHSCHFATYIRQGHALTVLTVVNLDFNLLGFYKYDAKRKASPDPELAGIVENSRQVTLFLHLGYDIYFRTLTTPHCFLCYSLRDS
jgi:hypothetical protein